MNLFSLVACRGGETGRRRDARLNQWRRDVNEQQTALLDDVRRAIDAADKRVAALTESWCDIQASVDDACRVAREHLDSTSPNWYRLLYATLRSMQERMERHGNNRPDWDHPCVGGVPGDAAYDVAADAAQVNHEQAKAATAER